MAGPASSLKEEFSCADCNRQFTNIFVYFKHRITHVTHTTQRIAKYREYYPCPICTRSSDSLFIKKEETFNECSDSFALFYITHHFNQPKPSKIYACLYCDKKLYSQGNLEKHLNTVHPNDDTHICGICYKVFAKRSSLYQHKTLHDERRFSCPYCNEKFARSSNYKRHIERKHTSLEKKYACEFCPKAFANDKYLKEHSRIHSDAECSICPLCKKKFARRYELRKHFSRRHVKTGEEFPCETCFKVFCSRESLKCHQKIHTDSGFTCNQCPKKFLRRKHLERHIETHTVREKLFPCDKCKKVLISEEGLKYHKRIHSETECVTCDKCGKKFSRWCDLRKHVIRLHTPRESPLSCPICTKSCANEECLKAHLRIHTVKEPIPCAECDKTFTSKGLLNIHVKRKHQKSEEKYACDVCCKAFTTKLYLESHKKSHTDECMSCPQCPKKFHWKSSYTEHLKTHERDTIFECDLCPRQFFNAKALRTHKARHNEKAVGCELCGKRLTNKLCLQRHMMRIHYETVNFLNCKICSKTFANKSELDAHQQLLHTVQDRIIINEILERPDVTLTICNLCDRKFSNLKELEKHLKSFHSNTLQDPLQRQLESLIQMEIKEECTMDSV